ncbi:MAG: hypothetical protein ACD_60C00010G0014 [uncultured bacterium]|nr:MAG: hypothetical protein ACD_60C00010G0014 [uncultured bacterium]
MSSLGTNYKNQSIFSRFKFLILPLALLGMVGNTMTFLNKWCTGNTRWLIIGLLATNFILKAKLFRYFDAKFALILFLYLMWCLLSAFWSDVPFLSFMKSGILIILSVTLIRSGIEWIRIKSLYNALDYLWMLAFATLIAGFVGKYGYSQEMVNDFNGTSIAEFQGLVRGANMFGALTAMSFPFFLWRTYLAFVDKKIYLFWFFLTVSCFLFLMLSFSRSAILFFLGTFLFFLMSIDINKKFQLFLVVIIIALGTVIIFPTYINALADVVVTHIYKGQTNYTRSLFSTRITTWQQSLEGAEEGGWMGLGYGVSFGQTNFKLTEDLKSYLYGREKGNSQLGIMEETGKIGLIFYLFLLCGMEAKLFKLFINAQNSDQRTLIGILMGTFNGMIMHSLFEAWWSSPGSPESIYFWTLIGIILGTEIRIKNNKVELNAIEIKTLRRNNLARGS